MNTFDATNTEAAEFFLEAIKTEFFLIKEIKGSETLRSSRIAAGDSTYPVLVSRGFTFGAFSSMFGVMRLWIAGEDIAEECFFDETDENLTRLATREVVAFLNQYSQEFRDELFVQGDTATVTSVLFPDLIDTPLKERRYMDGRINPAIKNQLRRDIKLTGGDVLQFIQENQINNDLMSELSMQVMQKQNAWTAQHNQEIISMPDLQSTITDGAIIGQPGTQAEGYLLRVDFVKAADPTDIAGQAELVFFLGTDEQHFITAVVRLEKIEKDEFEGDSIKLTEPQEGDEIFAQPPVAVKTLEDNLTAHGGNWCMTEEFDQKPRDRAAKSRINNPSND